MDKKKVINMKENKNKIILASSSLSRKRILRNLKINFIIKKPTTNEEKIKKKMKRKTLSTKKITYELAKQKSLSISKKNKNAIVVGCDTMIEVGKKTIDKAKNLNQAKKTLRFLSGKKHHIYSSIFVSKNNKKEWGCTTRSTVFIKKLSNNEINSYLKKTGKAVIQSVGCYHSETIGPLIFSKLNGDFYNIMGFPVLRFLKYIREKHPKLLL